LAQKRLGLGLKPLGLGLMMSCLVDDPDKFIYLRTEEITQIIKLQD